MVLKILPTLRAITNNPAINLLVGVILVSTGVIEAMSSIEALSVGVHHGAIVLGILHSLKYLPDFIEGFEYFQHIKTKEDQ